MIRTKNYVVVKIKSFYYKVKTYLNNLAGWSVTSMPAVTNCAYCFK